MPPSTTVRRHPRHWAETSIVKKVQHILGPRLATRANCLLLIITIQSLTIIYSLAAISSKNSNIADLQAQKDDEFLMFSRPPPEYNRPPSFSPFSHLYNDHAGREATPRVASILRQFLPCMPEPCFIHHWTYLGDKCFYRPNISKDHLAHNASVWNLVQNDWYYTPDNDFACPVAICRPQWPQELNLTRHLVSRALHHHFVNDTPWDMRRLYSGSVHVRLNPQWGLEYKLQGEIALTDGVPGGDDPSSASASVTVTRNKSVTVTVRRGFSTKFCDVSVDDDLLPAEEPVYVIVPCSGRLPQLRIFLHNVRSLLDTGVNIRVVLATHGGATQQLAAIELLRDLQLGLSEGPLGDGNDVQVVGTNGNEHTGNFSRSGALLAGVQYVPQDALLFFCDVDMEIDAQFFDNCRMNTRRGYQAYFPVVYSMFPYGRRVSREHGYWRRGAYGMVCIYKSDFTTTWAWVTHSNQRRLTGWGLEDVLLHQEVSNHWRMSVFEAVEPNLRHLWHAKHCQFNENVAACVSTVLRNLGSQQFLASIVASTGIDVRNVDYRPVPLAFEEYKNRSDGEHARGFDLPAAEGETDGAKIAQLRQLYDSKLASGRGGLLSLFAEEARQGLQR